MAPESARQKIEVAIVAAHLIRPKQDAIRVTNEKLPRALAALADLANHPARRAAVEVEIRIPIQEPLESLEVFRVPAHVRADPREFFRVARQHAFPHLAV